MTSKVKKELATCLKLFGQVHLFNWNNETLLT